jgi:hypothetical protein
VCFGVEAKTLGEYAGRLRWATYAALDWTKSMMNSSGDLRNAGWRGGRSRPGKTKSAWEAAALRNSKPDAQAADLGRMTSRSLHYVKVKGASLKNELLHVDLAREIPDAMTTWLDPIASSGDFAPTGRMTGDGCCDGLRRG